VHEPDLTWTMIGTVVWTSIEASVAVLSACLPTLRPLMLRLWLKRASTTTYQPTHKISGRSNQWSMTRDKSRRIEGHEDNNIAPKRLWLRARRRPSKPDQGSKRCGYTTREFTSMKIDIKNHVHRLFGLGSFQITPSIYNNTTALGRRRFCSAGN